MKVKTVTVDGKNLPQRYYDAGNTKQTQFSGLKIGDEYLVYGISLFRGCLLYLINTSSEGVDASWKPAAIFNVVDNSIPTSWIFDYFVENEEYGVAGIWGYKELVLSDSHYEGLIERKTEDIILFAKNMKLSYPIKGAGEDCD